MSEMVERVARAMGDAADACCDDMGILDPDLLLDLAAAALAAMREPTPAMLRAVVKWAGFEDEPDRTAIQIADEMWKVGLDAALAETPDADR
jgi:hypothetical protein